MNQGPLEAEYPVSMVGKSPGESFRVEATGICTKCGQSVAGWIAFGNVDPARPKQGPTIVVDTGGFMAFADGVVCDACLSVGASL